MHRRNVRFGYVGSAEWAKRDFGVYFFWLDKPFYCHSDALLAYPFAVARVSTHDVLKIVNVLLAGHRALFRLHF